MKLPVILFFISSATPSMDEFKQAHSMKAQVKFRNSTKVPNEGSLEPCDGVAGDVPERYAKTYPSFEEGIIAFEEKQQKLIEELPLDEVAPVAKLAENKSTKNKSDDKATKVWGAQT
jgi:hypothetical protein